MLKLKKLIGFVAKYTFCDKINPKKGWYLYELF